MTIYAHALDTLEKLASTRLDREMEKGSVGLNTFLARSSPHDDVDPYLFGPKPSARHPDHTRHIREEFRKPVDVRGKRLENFQRLSELKLKNMDRVIRDAKTRSVYGTEIKEVTDKYGFGANPFSKMITANYDALSRHSAVEKSLGRHRLNIMSREGAPFRNALINHEIAELRTLDPKIRNRRSIAVGGHAGLEPLISETEHSGVDAKAHGVFKDIRSAYGDDEFAMKTLTRGGHTPNRPIPVGGRAFRSAEKKILAKPVDKGIRNNMLFGDSLRIATPGGSSIMKRYENLPTSVSEGLKHIYNEGIHMPGPEKFDKKVVFDELRRKLKDTKNLTHADLHKLRISRFLRHGV
jgi:hypothetical protein